jgi:hypothetical protein
MQKAYHQALSLLRRASSTGGFLAADNPVDNYQRVWARDGVICGMAALASQEDDLIAVFKKTLQTLQEHQHPNGTIPSNVLFHENKNSEISYGGLAGRVDATTWYIIGVCHYTLSMQDFDFFKRHKKSIDQCLTLLEAWEFNQQDLLYVPLSGNWADEYITDGYVLYDQLLRLWGLRLLDKIEPNIAFSCKKESVEKQIKQQFFPNQQEGLMHPRAYQMIQKLDYLPCSFSPSGYKTRFDAFAHSLFLILNLGDSSIQNDIVNHFTDLIHSQKLKLSPAFWPPVFPEEQEWTLLSQNYKYAFRNFPFEFHNGGVWPMVNGFVGIAMYDNQNTKLASQILTALNQVNEIENYGFYENFNAQTGLPNGVKSCTWSAAATVLLNQVIEQKFKFIT